MPDLSSVPREAARVGGLAYVADRKRSRSDQITASAAYEAGFTECVSRLPSRGEIADAFALRAYPRGVFGDRFEGAAEAARQELRAVFLAQADAVLDLIGEHLKQ